MFNSKMPENVELPSTALLIRSTLLALAGAGILLVTVVLPSEYGIDPTGLGRLIGLTEMGEIKVALEDEIEAAAEADPAPAAEPQAPVEPASPGGPAVAENHEISLTLNPGQAAEIKLKMSKGKAASYVWWTERGPLNFDVHADSEPLEIDYHPYEKGRSERREGTLTAAFDGYHGWFWRNRTDGPVTVNLKTSGDYQEFKRVL